MVLGAEGDAVVLPAEGRDSHHGAPYSGEGGGGQEGCGWTGPWVLRGREVTGEAWGLGRGEWAGSGLCEPLPWGLLRYPWTSFTKHRFKGKITKNFSTVTAQL